MQSSNLIVHDADANQTSSKVRLAGNTAARLLAGAMRTILCFDRSVIVARPRLDPWWWWLWGQGDPHRIAHRSYRRRSHWSSLFPSVTQVGAEVFLGLVADLP